MTDTPATPRHPRGPGTEGVRDAPAMRPRPPLRGVVLTVLCVVLAACSDVASRPGGLTIDVTGLPAGAEAAVTVHDGDEDALAVTASGPVANASPGDYVVRAEPVTVDHVPFDAEPAEQRIRVEDGAHATAHVTYAPSGAEGAADEDGAATGAQGVTRGETLQGVLWSDRDGDGRFGRGDTVLGGATVYLDLDDDGARDGDEPATRTDPAGQYRFDDLTAGTSFTLRHEAAEEGDGALQASTLDTPRSDVKHHVWHGAGSTEGNAP